MTSKWLPDFSMDNKKHGKDIEWYENGQKKREGEFLKGKRHGKLTIWHENGQKASDIR
tara:strand:- start:75 stop:248 length:174 start_codon:yes stop_codon:yes gene_type:complete